MKVPMPHEIDRSIDQLSELDDIPIRGCIFSGNAARNCAAFWAVSKKRSGQFIRRRKATLWKA